MEQKKYCAAVDLSGVEASFAVAENGSETPCFAKNRPMRGRTAALLLEWVLDCLKESNIELDQIKKWTVGSGPGSFTGLRMAASLVGGLIFDKAEVKARSLPTALGLAAGLAPAAGEKVAVLFDGRNHELLLFGVAVESNGQLVADGATEVVNVDNARELCGKYDRLAAFGYDRTAIEGVLYPDLFNRVELIEHLPIEKMLNIESDNWNNDLTELVYIRQAVFVKPMEIKTV